MSQTSTGSISLPHSCPCPRYGCSTVATDMKSMDRLFGFRTIDDAIRNQSWCIECRRRALQESRAIEKLEKEKRSKGS